MVDTDDENFTIQEQCEWLDVPRSTFYYSPQVVAPQELTLMQRIDELYMKYPFFGCRKMAAMLEIDKDYANRLMRKMGIEAIYPKKKTSLPDKNHEIFPYLLRGVKIEKPDHVWSTDITYVPMAQGFMYLTAVIDWHSRYVISWRLSNTLDKHFCIDALQVALAQGVRPSVFNTDQGSQFTSREFTDVLKNHGVKISMDGRGRCLDNIFIERLWRSVKYEEIYLNAYESVFELETRLRRYFDFYNHVRPHQSLANLTPARVYNESAM
jgi:Transposase and inactivated derivatives